jgi:hypothetical protein
MRTDAGALGVQLDERGFAVRRSATRPGTPSCWSVASPPARSGRPALGIIFHDAA